MLTFVAQTSALTYAPAARADLAGGRPLRTLRRLQPDELSPKVAGGVDRQRLVAALGAYAAQKAPAPSRDGDPAPRGLVRAPWRAPRVLSAAPAAPQRWPSPADPRDAPVTDDGKHPAPFRRLQSFSGTCLGWTFEGLLPFPGLPLREGWGVGRWPGWSCGEECQTRGSVCRSSAPAASLFPGLVDKDAGGRGTGPSGPHGVCRVDHEGRHCFHASPGQAHAQLLGLWVSRVPRRPQPKVSAVPVAAGNLGL